MYTRINEKLKPSGKEALAAFFDDFQNALKIEIDKINNSVDNTIPNYVYATNVIMVYSSFIFSLKYLFTRFSKQDY